MNGQNVAASVERLQEITDSVRRVLGGKRSWLTPEEFLAQVEAHKRQHDKARLNAKLVNNTPSEVREYRLKPYVVFNRQLELKRLGVGQ